MQLDPQLFQVAYEEVKLHGINHLVTELRENPLKQHQIKRKALTNLFKNLPLWERQNQSSGHVTFKHKITGIVVGFQNHSGKNNKETKIHQDQAVALMNNLQEHMNILGNEIFKYTTHNWKTTPNYDLALTNYRNYLARRLANT